MSEGFLGRWARRKQDALAGRPQAEPAPPIDPAITPTVRQTPPTIPDAPTAPHSPAAETAPPPTLEDVHQLTPQSDFKPFMAQEVAPEVKNAAMKKLFTDPHFNVMDGLDIYIDDYSQPDPLPAPMLRKLASAQFLNLFGEDETDKPAVPAVTTPSAAADASQPATHNGAARSIPQENHADPDLRLQQDHAAGAQGSEHGT